MFGDPGYPSWFITALNNKENGPLSVTLPATSLQIPVAKISEPQ